MSDRRIDDFEVVDLKVEGADQLLALAKRMKAAGQGQLRRELLKAIRTEANPIVKDLQQAILAIQVTGVRGGGTAQRRAHRKGKGKNHGLRASVARAVEVKITTSGFRTGVRIRINKAKLPADQRTLPKYLNGGRWRHPVFGNTDYWAEQSTGKEFWEPTIAPHSAAVRAGMAATLERFAAELDSA